MKHADMAAVAATQRDLAEIAKTRPALAESALAAVALAMACELDSGRNSATSKSMCARALAEVMRELRELAPAKREESPLDEIRARRDAKVVRASRTPG